MSECVVWCIHNLAPLVTPPYPLWIPPPMDPPPTKKICSYSLFVWQNIENFVSLLVRVVILGESVD